MIYIGPIIHIKRSVLEKCNCYLTDTSPIQGDVTKFSTLFRVTPTSLSPRKGYVALVPTFLDPSVEGGYWFASMGEFEPIDLTPSITGNHLNRFGKNLYIKEFGRFVGDFEITYGMVVSEKL